jgi:hypothetical protein
MAMAPAMAMAMATATTAAMAPPRFGLENDGQGACRVADSV